MKYTLLTISDSDKHFASAIAEYHKRMPKNLTTITLKPTKYGTREQIIAKETDHVIQKISSHTGLTILLSKEGKQLSTHELKQQLMTPDVSSVLLIIGGPYGLDEQRLLPHIDHRISLGLHTMPHGLAKLVLIEQLYRIQTIRDGKSYHY